MNEHNHIVKSYDQEQAALLDELIRMGEMSVAQLEAALDVLERRDDRAAERVIANDDAIDALEHQVNQDVVRLIRRGPMATDLRIILAALRVASDIERIGDLAANIAKRSMALNLAPPLPHTRGLDALGRGRGVAERRGLDQWTAEGRGEQGGQLRGVLADHGGVRAHLRDVLGDHAELAEL